MHSYIQAWTLRQCKTVPTTPTGNLGRTENEFCRGVPVTSSLCSTVNCMSVVKLLLVTFFSLRITAQSTQNRLFKKSMGLSFLSMATTKPHAPMCLVDDKQFPVQWLQ